MTFEIKFCLVKRFFLTWQVAFSLHLHPTQRSLTATHRLPPPYSYNTCRGLSTNLPPCCLSICMIPCHTRHWSLVSTVVANGILSNIHRKPCLPQELQVCFLRYKHACSSRQRAELVVQRRQYEGFWLDGLPSQVHQWKWGDRVSPASRDID